MNLIGVAQDQVPVNGLLGDLAFMDLSSLLPFLNTKNGFINGGMQVAQRGDLTLGSSAPAANAGYGKVDRWQCWATGTAVSAGTATQTTSANCGRTGYALKLSGVTLTGTGVVFIKQRVESVNAVRFKNQTASVSVRVYHDVGSSINYTITIRKPTASDNYTSTTTIATGSATSVASATETLLKLENISMGDCSFGIEVEIKAECGAITTKNFEFTEAQIEVSAAFTSFEYVSFDQDLQRCLRYYEKSMAYGTAPANDTATSDGGSAIGSWGGSATVCWASRTFYKCPKRSTATVTFYSITGGTASRWWFGASAEYATMSTEGSNTTGFTGVGTVGSVADYRAGAVKGHWQAESEL